MSGPQPGFLATYNSLTDKHLAGYFSNAKIRRHLRRSGLISRSGRILSEKEYRLNAMKRDQQRYVQECLARAIFHKVLDMERHHQQEIRRKLENSMRKERVQRIKVQQSRRLAEGASYMHAPFPPLGPRSRYGLHPLVAGEPAGHSQARAPVPAVGYTGGHPSQQHQAKEPAFSKMASWRPNTAPGHMQRPPRLQPLRCAAAGSVPKASSSKNKCHVLGNNQHFASEEERSGLRLMNSMEYVAGTPRHQLPVISSHMVPVPPPPLQKGDRSLNAVRNRVPRGRRFRPTTAPNGLEQLLTKNSGGFPKPSLRSNVFVTMVFLGKSVHLSHDGAAYRDEIKVYQQHCGGENLCVYKGKLLEGETFQFVSKRHHGFPFSLTFFLNGMQVDRLSCCCEYKHQKRSRLGGRHGYFGFLSVEGASPCYRCIIAMGLDKKPSPPKRKMEDHEENPVGSWRDGEHSEPNKSSVEQKSSKASLLVIIPGHEASVETVEDKMENKQKYRKEEKEELSDRESEDSQKDTSKNEYDEDFEADEEVNEVGQTGDQMNGMSKSSSDDKLHNLDYENESKTSSQKALQASDSEKEQSDGYSDSNSEDDKRDGRAAHSVSSISTQYSSDNDSDAETMEDDVKGKEDHNIKTASDDAEHAQYGNESRENKLLRMEENQETFTLEKEGIDEAEKAEAEDLTVREDTGIFDENIMAIEQQSPEVPGELKQAGSGEGDIREDGEKNASARRDDGKESLLVPLESNVMQGEDSNEGSPRGDGEGGSEYCKAVQEETAMATGSDHYVNSQPEPGDSGADEGEENITSTERGASEAPDGDFLAEGTRPLDVQKAAEQVVGEGQMVGEREALEKEGFVAERGDAHTEEAGEDVARAGDSLPEEDTVAVLQVEEPTPQESTMAGEDPRGRGTGMRTEPGAAVSPGEQEEGTESEAALGEQVPGAEEPTATLLGKEEDGVVAQGQEVAGEVPGAEEAVEEGSGTEEAVEEGSGTEEAVEEVPGAEEAVEEGSGTEEAAGAPGPAVKEGVGGSEGTMEEGGFSGKDVVAGAVSEGEEAAGDASVAGEGIAGVVGPAGEEPVEKGVSGEAESVEKPGALLETLGDMNVCTGEAMVGGEDFVKPSEFSQLKASGEEQMEVGEAAIRAAASETSKASEAGGGSVLGAEDAVQETVEAGGGPVLEVAPGLEAPVDVEGDPISEGSSQLEETTAAEEEGSAGALSSGTPSPGSRAETEGAMEGKPDGGALGESAGTGRAEPGGGGEGPREVTAGMEGSLECAGERGRERAPGEALDEAVLAPVLCVGRGGEAGLVAIAVVGGQAGPGAHAEGEAGEPAVAGVSPRHRELCGEVSLGEQPESDPPPSTPIWGYAAAEPRGKGSAGCQGPCQGNQPQLVALRTGTAGDKNGPQEGTGQEGVRAEGGQPGPCGNTGEREEGGVWGGSQGAPGLGEQRKDGPTGGSAAAPRAAGVGERSRGPHGDVVNPDTVVVPLVQPQDGEETLL